MSTITVEQQQRIADWLEAHPILAVGVGSRDEACSIAAINLALSGRLTDEIPECMSEVIGRWIIVVQDAMPDEIRNSAEWRGLLPLAAGTGRDHERERMNILLDWMWGTVLPVVQPVADAQGFGAAWSTMLVKRSPVAARATADVAEAARAADAAGAAARAAAAAWAAARAAARAAAWAVAEATHTADAAWAAARAAAAADAAGVVAWVTGETTWRTFDPVGVLQRLIEVGSDV